MRIIRAPSLLGLWLALSCLACFAVLACKSAPEATHQDFSDCITELDALGGHGRTVSWESVVDVLKRHTSEFREIDGGTEAGVTYYEYEMKISGDDYWVNMGGQHRGPAIGGWLEISMVTFREGLAAKRGKVVAEVEFRD
jgi:hypothetical protein